MSKSEDFQFCGVHEQEITRLRAQLQASDDSLLNAMAEVERLTCALTHEVGFREQAEARCVRLEKQQKNLLDNMKRWQKIYSDNLFLVKDIQAVTSSFAGEGQP